MSKSRIHRESRGLSRCITNSLNGIMNWGEKLGKLIFLKRKIQDKFTKSKITLFRLILREKSKSIIRREKLIAERENDKIKLIY